MKKHTIMFVILLLNIVQSHAQIVVESPTLATLLVTNNTQQATASATALSTKLQVINNYLTNLKQLNAVIDAADKLSKVASYIKDGRTIVDIYDTEKRILRKVRVLSNNQSSDFSSNNAAQIKNTIIETTGQLVDKGIQVISDDIFNMSDFQRENVLEEILEKLQQIEDLISNTSTKNTLTNIDIEYHQKQADFRKEYGEILKERRRKINAISSQN